MATKSDPALQRAPVSFIDLGHCELAYRQVGSGPPLVLVHGYPLSGLTFRHLTPGLAEHFTCYVTDLPGLGETRWTDRTDFMFAAQAETLKAFIDALGLSSYAVVAHDTGATIARRLAVTDRGRLTRMALIGTEIPGHRPPWIPLFQKIANPKQTGVFKFLMGRRWFRRSSAGFGGCFTDLSLIDGEFRDLILKPMLADDRRISGQTRYLMGIDWALVDALKIDHAKIAAPVLLVWGEDDPVFPVEEARPMAAQFADCAGFVTVPNGKLFVHEEMPEVVLPILLDFLLRDGAAGTAFGSGAKQPPERLGARP
jgi:pimeloyl-ACP methyl ester carboxylesterase